MRLSVFLQIMVIILLVFPVSLTGEETSADIIADEEQNVSVDNQDSGEAGSVDPPGALARSTLSALTSFGSRAPGSVQEEQAGAYISSALSSMGYPVTGQSFSFSNEDEGDLISSSNIIAVKPGRSSEEIIIGAHYDSTDEGAGADDNAASVAVLLETASRLYGVDTPYTIRFVAFGAEEADLDGSRYYVTRMNQTVRKNTRGMINLDSIIAGDKVYVYGDEGVSVRDMLLQAAQESGLKPETRSAPELDEDDGTPCECSDYYPFQTAGIPFVYLESTNWDLGEEDGLTQTELVKGEDGVIRHTRFDTLSYIDSAFPGRVDHRLSGIVRALVSALT